jgi:inosine-uridine nucleoside N-ribohydrolase
LSELGGGSARGEASRHVGASEHEHSLYVDADTALGSPRGDVDDAFALTALLLSGRHVAAISSVAGNASEAHAFRNNRSLAELCGFGEPLLRGGDEAGEFLAACATPLRVVALGPLTNVAAGLRRGARPAEIVIVGGNAASRGCWPPLWPFEFNLYLDRPAMREVYESDAPLSFVTLDVARRLRMCPRDLAPLPGALGEHLRRHSRRWFRRSRLLYGRGSVPVWDLAAALYVLEPERFQIRESCARLHDNGWLEFGAGDRPVRLVGAFDRAALWRGFADRMHDFAAGGGDAPVAPLAR